MARILLTLVLVSLTLSIQNLDARRIQHERFIQRWFKWRLPGLEVERWKSIEKHRPAKRDVSPISNESGSEQIFSDGESNEESTDDLSRLPAISKESTGNEPPELIRVPLEKSIAPPIFPPLIGGNNVQERAAEGVLTNIGLSQGIKEYLQSTGGVLPVIPKIPEPEVEVEGPLKMHLPLEEHEIKPPPPPMFLREHFVLEEKKIKEPPFFEPEIKKPEPVPIVHVEEHQVGPPIIEIPPPPPPHPEVVIPHVIQAEIKPILVEMPPEVRPIPAPPLPPMFKPEIKPPEIVEITHVVETDVKPPPIEAPPEIKPPPPLAGPIAIGTRWMFFFGDMLLHALSEIITGARSGLVQYTTTATEQ